MDVMTARQAPERFDRSARFQRGGQPCVKKICKYWRAGTCNRQPCAFIHSDLPHPQPLWELNQTSLKNKRNFNHMSSTNVSSPTENISTKNTWRNPESTVLKRLKFPTNPVMASEVDTDQGKANKINANGMVSFNAERVKNINATVPSKKAPSSKIDTDQRVTKDIVRTAASIELVGAEVNTDQGADKKILNTKGSGLPSRNADSLNSPTKGDTQVEAGQTVDSPQSKLLTFCGSGFSMITKLEGHTKAVSGVVFPSGSKKLFSASRDETVRGWDCNSGQCVNNVKMEGEIQCLHTEGQWVFAGLKNAVKAWNFQTQTEHVLNGPNGLVHALSSSFEMLFAGVQGGSICVWKTDFGSDCPKPMATLKGHNLTVLSLTVGKKRLYSGSEDCTIRVWDLESLECVEILTAHSDFVTSLLCWSEYLLSGSLDKTLKVWGDSESGNLDVEYEVKKESGIITFQGIMDAENKPILLCSYKDNTVRLYELPSFVERGRIFGEKEIQAIEIGWFGGLFFTGEATGQLSVWKLDGEFKPVTS